MRFFEITLGFVILPFSVAISCTDSSAFAWPLTDDSSSSGSGGPGSSIGSCSSGCGNSISCVQTCLSFEQQSNCNILGGSACTDTSSSGSIGGGDDDDNGGLIKKRDTLDCDSDETCFAYKDGTLLCLDISTGYYRDETGRTGGILDDLVDKEGSSTAVGSGGSKTTLAGLSATAGISISKTTTNSGLTQTTFAGSSATTGISTSKTTTNSGLTQTTLTNSSSSPTTTSNPTSPTGPSGRVTSVTPTGGAQVLGVGAAIGALGLAIGLVL